MATYIRFDDTRYYGESKYRPGEGWIDVHDEIDPRRLDRTNLTNGWISVRCVIDRAVQLLLAARLDGRRPIIRFAVVEERTRAFYIRFAMAEVELQGFQINPTHVDEPTSAVLELRFAKATITVWKDAS
jgi:hypothetical protein